MHLIHVWQRSFKFKQESPPAWMQEAYRPPCSKYSLCCPNWVPPWPGYPPGQGTPPGWTWQGTPPSQGTPPARVSPPPQLDLAGYPPPPAGPGRVTPPPWLPHGILGNVAKHCGIWVPPPSRGQTDWWTDTCQNITFPSYYVRGR